MTKLHKRNSASQKLMVWEQALSGIKLLKLNFTAITNLYSTAFTPSHSCRMTAASNVWYYLKHNHKKKRSKWHEEGAENLPQRLAGSILPSTHCSDRILLPSGLLPLYFPMQIPAWRTLLQTVPPQSWISSTRLWVGGWECWDTNMAGWLWKRSCWCSPADRCLWRRQTWAEKLMVKYRNWFQRGSIMTHLFTCSVQEKHQKNR